jgi:hypothetical protein
LSSEHVHMLRERTSLRGMPGLCTVPWRVWPSKEVPLAGRSARQWGDP